MSVPIYNRFHATPPNSGKITILRGGYSCFMQMCANLLEPKELGLKLLKSTFNAENFISRSFWSIVSQFGAIYSQSVRRNPKSRKIH